MTITKYVIVDEDDEQTGEYYDSLFEARANVPDDQPWAIVEYEFEYSDSSLIETSTGEDTWPPDPRVKE